jgi:type II secretory pathway component GspD/PulD (secretin)
MSREWMRVRRPAVAAGLLLIVSAALFAAERPLPAKPPAAKTATPTVAKPSVLPPALKSAAPENEMDLLIAQALDQKTAIEFKDVPIREALKQLSDKTGIPIVMETGTVRFLPYGSDTRITASVSDQTLRDVLNGIVRPVGLRFAAEGGKVVVRASRALQRLARRATWAELAQLEMLGTKPWSDELFKSLKIQFQDSQGNDLEANREELRKAAQGIGAGTASQILEHATDKFGWTWYPADDHIVVISKPREIERQLQRRVSFEFKQAALKDVLVALAQEACVPLKLDPGVLANIPAALADGYTLSVENASVRQIFEIIAGQTGLGYVIEPEDVRIMISPTANTSSSSQPAVDVELAAQRTAAAMRTNSFVGQLTVPGKDGTTYSFFIRENDLPPDVNELRKSKLKEAGEQIRFALTATTRPRD